MRFLGMRAESWAAAALIAAVVGLVSSGCRREREQPQDAKSRTLEHALEQVRSTDVNERRQGASLLLGTCCEIERQPAEVRRNVGVAVPLACLQIANLLVDEREGEVLEGLLGAPNGACFARFPASVLVAACGRRCPRTLVEDCVEMLGVTHPSPELTPLLIARLTDPDEDVRRAATQALAGYGEAELGPMIGALGSSDPRVRSAAARALGYAADAAPLELPSLERALVQAVRDPDPVVRRDAGVAWALWAEWSRATPDEAVAKMTAARDDAMVARLLGARTFFCNSKLVGPLLRGFTEDRRSDVSAAAKLALRLRAERCPRAEDRAARAPRP